MLKALLVGAAAGLLGLLGWWALLEPSNDREWADDVARVLVARADPAGRHVTLDNVRNFEWRSETDYTARWERREYDLDQVASADLILSYWMGPAIAHTLVAFNFDDGRRIVFSLEIRKERTEQFSAVAGFFRQYEEVLVAADERDIVRVRTNVRGEDDYLYRLVLDRPLLRKTFLAYVQRANRLERVPEFYNTVSSNCTTILYDIARGIEPDLPIDYRLLLSGYFAEYAYDHGALVPGVPFDNLKAAGRITQRALASGDSADFSAAIRAGIPGIPAPPRPSNANK